MYSKSRHNWAEVNEIVKYTQDLGKRNCSNEIY